MDWWEGTYKERSKKEKIKDFLADFFENLIALTIASGLLFILFMALCN